MMGSLSLPGLAQSAQEGFGKNRLQHQRFNWRNLSAANFDIYYYDSGTRLANFAIRFLETEFDKITDILGYTPYYKAKIFIYNSITDLQQSNVGIDNDLVITGGQTDFYKSQVEIPFTGSEVDFKSELRRGVAQMLIREMMFGGSLKDMLQSAYLGKFNEWFLLGAAAYVADGWSQEMDDQLRDLFRSKRAKKPNLYEGREAILIGQSIWNFIAEEYGAANISNILNLARIIRNERNSIGNSLGIGYGRFLTRWQTYYRDLAQEANQATQALEYDFKLRKHNRKNRIFNEFKINPAGNKIAYSENRNGRYRVVVQNLQNRRRKTYMRSGYKAIGQRYDENIPLLSWRDNNNLGIMYVKKGQVRLKVLNAKKKKTYFRKWEFFNHVSGFDFSDDGNFLVMSADRQGQVEFKTGQNDIYWFDIEKVNLEVLTDDWYDDQDPMFLTNSNRAFVFSSNRIKDTLSTTLRTEQGNYAEQVNNFDIFIYDPASSQTRLERLTNAPGPERKPRLLDDKTILYLNESSGISQLYAVNRQTKRNLALSNTPQSLLRFDVNMAENGLAYLTTEKGRFFPYYKKDFDFNQSLVAPFQTERAKTLAARTPQANATSQLPPKTPEGFEPTQPLPTETYGSDEVDTDNYVFDPDIVAQKQSGLEKAQEKMLEQAKNSRKNEVKVIGPYDYSPRFGPENLITSIQIDPLRGWGILLNASTSDLLENHEFQLGFNIIADLRSNDISAEYRYRGRRVDFGVKYERNKYFFNSGNVFQTYLLNRYSGTVSYPIRNTSRISVSPTYVTTKSIHTGLVGSNPLLYSVPSNQFHYAGAKLEYVYDNTVRNGQNMILGTRIKASFESLFNVFMSDHIKAFDIANSEFNFSKLSLDVRNYTKIHRDLIFATRVAYGRFMGNSPKSFMVGGMDNWLFNQVGNGGRDFNPADTEFRTDRFFINPNGEIFYFGNEDIVFNEFVTNLRGFDFNKISGENFFLVNLELRFPFIKYLFGRRVNSNFLKNLQIAGFYDIGTAWTGISPFNRENSTNTRRIIQPPFEAIVNDFKNPWLVGYGFGVRTILLSYYLKMDVAWAVEDFVTTDTPRFYFTLGYDF
ncbi:MAG: hypothetical protein HC913_17840 [Microscillaceae bacterium]|nr:hypothetical protein [Microscillaceae bacterium]